MNSAKPRSSPATSSVAPWTFLTNHAHVLLCIAADPSLRIRDISDLVGITERGIQRIIMELEEAGYLAHEHAGRRNVYHVRSNRPLRHPLERHKNVGVLLSLIGDAPKRKARA